IPEVAGAHLAVGPQAVLALVGAGGLHFAVRLGAVGQFDIGVGIDGFHEGVGDADGNVEIGEVALVLGVDEDFDIRMVAAQHAHLGATAGAGGFDGFAGAVEDAHVGDRAGSARLGALDAGALRSDGRKVVADAAAATHGFGGLGQRSVDAGTAVGVLDDGVADRLHEAVDQRRLEVGSGGGVDAAGRNEAVFLGPQKAVFPVRPVLLQLDLSQCPGDALAHVVDAYFLTLGVFFDQHFAGNLLLLQGGEFGGGGNVGQRELFGYWAHFLLLGMASLIGLVSFRMSSNLLDIVGQCNPLTRYGILCRP